MIKPTKTNIDMPDVISLADDLEHLSQNNRHALIRKSTGEWVILNEDAYNFIISSQGMNTVDAISTLSNIRQEQPIGYKSIIALIKLLLNKGIIVSVDNNKVNEKILINPRTVSFTITNRCNLSCIMCFADASSEDQSDNNELSTDQIIEILAKLERAGCAALRITGGEPFLRSDLIDILGYARPRFEHILLQTNGTLIDDVKAGKLVGLTNDVRIPLDGPTADIHDQLRGKGCFDAAMNGIRCLQKAGVAVSIFHTLTKLSYSDIQCMIDLSQSLNTRMVTGFYSLVGRGEKAKDKLLIEHDMFCDPDITCGNYDMDVCNNVSNTSPYVYNRTRSRCSAITDRISISPHGTVYPCEFMRNPEFALGSILESDSLTEMLNSDNQVIKTLLSRTVDNVSSCKECNVRYFCNGLCMAEAYAHSGSIWNNDPYCIVKKIELSQALWGNM
ncbi:MAG: radical SAM protein [Armatimonadota bacterium]